MHTISKWTMTLALLSAAAHGQVPSTNDTSDGSSNTGMGTFALGGPAASNAGYDNTAAGYYALGNNTTGSYNAAFGYYALYYNTTANDNTASGYDALYFNTTGHDNTAAGEGALYLNTTGSNNTAVGESALKGALISGSYNTGIGARALYSITTASNNTASGYQAMYANKAGSNNTASGHNAMYYNRGSSNAAFGQAALRSNTTGNFNIAFGYQAGYYLTAGSYNIDIGNMGVAGESGVIRIGTESPTPRQSKTYIAGIYDNTSVSGIAVVIDSDGQLGTVSSSERFKTDITPMGSNTARLQQLRPVTFHYKADSQGALRYGLIAEEVAKVYPELVIRDRKGRIDAVRYDELAPMLLNEMQRQHVQMTQKIDALAKINAAQAEQIAAQGAQLRDMQQQFAVIQAAFSERQSKHELVAQR